MPDTMKRGVPPTARKARTGEFTPPGVTWDARSKSDCETGASYEYDTWVLTCENEWAGGYGRGAAGFFRAPPGERSAETSAEGSDESCVEKSDEKSRALSRTTPCTTSRHGPGFTIFLHDLVSSPA
ncbi:hypothetical protein GCM10023237_27240 [Streptomyces coeruleoprunus]